MKRLVICLLYLLSLFGCSAEKGLPEDAVILTESYSNSGHVVTYADANRIYLYDYETRSSKLQTACADPKPSLALPEVTKTIPLGKDPFDLEVLYPSLKTDSAYAYSLSLEQSSSYIKSLLGIGCKVKSMYRCSDYIDYTLIYKDRCSRVIITSSLLRIFIIS